MRMHPFLSTLLTLPLVAPVLAAHVLDAQAAAPIRTITIASANTFTVPSGVSTLTVEGWGGGGGGAYTGGGGGGGYFRIVLSVTAGATLTLSPGAGGTAGSGGSFGGSGGSTTMEYKAGSTTIDCTAVGGAGSQYFVDLVSTTYFCTGPSTAGIPLAYTGKPGHYGDVPRTIALGPRSATSYTASVIGGNGGDAGNAPGTGGQGNTQTYALLINTNAATGTPPTQDPVQANVSYNISQARLGLVPGGGGGGTASVADPNLPGAAGAAGLLLVSY